MCGDCDLNINNEGEIIPTYSAISLGNGQPIYAGSVVVADNTEFQFKSIKAGTNVTLDDDGSTIKIDVADSINTIQNIGGFVEVFEGTSGGVSSFRTLKAGGSITLTQNADNIEIVGTDTVGTISNIGTGQALVASDLPNATVKTLVAGSNIFISNTVDTVTIANSMTPITGVTNLGTGPGQPLVDVLGSNVRARTLSGLAGTIVAQSGNDITILSNTDANVGAGAQVFQGVSGSVNNFRSIVQSTDISVVQNANDLTITSIVPKSRPLIQFYNYMTSPIIDFSTYYQVAPTLSILSSSVVGFPNPTTEGTVTVLTATAFQFIPAPRLDRPVVIFVQLIFNNGSYTTLSIELQPILTWANDTAHDLLLASGVDDVLYQIDNQNSTIKQMVNYDFTPVFLGTGLTALAMNQADNILFFTLSATPTTIQYYDFATKLSGVVTNFNSTVGWTPGANISSMTFDQKDCVLYILGDTNAAVCRVIHIPPLNRAVGFVFGASPSYNSPFVSLAGNIQQSLAIDRYSKALYGVVDPSASNCQLRTLNFLAGTPSTNSLLTLGDQSAHCEVGPSSLVYCIGDTSLQMRKTKANRNTNNTTTTFISAIAFRDLTVSPYGILAP